MKNQKNNQANNVKQLLLIASAPLALSLAVSVAVFVAVDCSLFIQNAEAAVRTCQGCKELLALKEKFVATRDKGIDSHYPQVEKVADAIGKLKRQADGMLDKQQVEAVIEMLDLEKNREYRQLLVEKNITLFRDNHDLLVDAAKKNTVAGATAVLKDVDIVIREYAVGQDPPVEKKNQK
jgi:hypothetical protein